MASAQITEEGIALIRIWLYLPGRFFITDTISKECSSISETIKLQTHSSFASHTYWGVPVKDIARTVARADELIALHGGRGDCLALAEAEDAGLDVLLTYDKRFLKLGSASQSSVQLHRPTEYWSGLAIPKGAPLANRPTQGNPLEGQLWWRW